jgi:hypothetical protein
LVQPTFVHDLDTYSKTVHWNESYNKNQQVKSTREYSMSTLATQYSTPKMNCIQCCCK